MLNEVINLLDLPDEDYWYDEGSSQARTLIDGEGQTLLPRIAEVWSTWPELRQTHLAYILGEGSSSLEREILELMALSKSPEVSFRARESIRSAESPNT